MKKLFNLIFSRRKEATPTALIENDVSEPTHETASSVPSGDYRFIAIDVETANSNRHSICQIGIACVRMDNTMEVFSQLVYTDETFHDFNIGIHGIAEWDVEDAPSFETLIQNLRPLLERHTLIQHSNFDKQAINGSCDYFDLPALNTTWIDSVIIARRSWPAFKGNGGHGLANLKKEFDLKFRHHDAGEDARAAAEVVVLAEEETGVGFRDIIKQTAGRKS